MGAVNCDAATGGVTTSGGGLLSCCSGVWTTGGAAVVPACEVCSAVRSNASCASTFASRWSAEVCSVALLTGGRLLGPASSDMVVCRGVPAG
jgi:hypothetical protein